MPFYLVFGIITGGSALLLTLLGLTLTKVEKVTTPAINSISNIASSPLMIVGILIAIYYILKIIK